MWNVFLSIILTFFLCITVFRFNRHVLLFSALSNSMSNNLLIEAHSFSFYYLFLWVRKRASKPDKIWL